MTFNDNESCLGEFTEQQAGRMHCWIASRLWGWVCYGDADQDLDVDDDDYDRVLEDLNLEGDFLASDLNKDGVVDDDDLDIAAEEWGKDCTDGTTPCSS